MASVRAVCVNAHVRICAGGVVPTATIIDLIAFDETSGPHSLTAGPLL